MVEFIKTLFPFFERAIFVLRLKWKILFSLLQCFEKLSFILCCCFFSLLLLILPQSQCIRDYPPPPFRARWYLVFLQYPYHDTPWPYSLESRYWNSFPHWSSNTFLVINAPFCELFIFKLFVKMSQTCRRSARISHRSPEQGSWRGYSPSLEVSYLSRFYV